MNRFFLLLFGMVTFVAHAQVPDYVPTEGLVAWHSFTGNSDDSSENGHHGVVTGTELSSDRFSTSESAYSFNYDTYSNGSLGDMIWMSHSEDFNVSQLSVSIWFRQTAYSYPGNPGSQAIIKRVENGYSNPVGEFWSIVMNDDGVLSCHLHNSNNLVFATPEGTIELNEWYHVVMTYDNENLRVYLNGEPVGAEYGQNWMRTEGVSGISIGVSNQANGYWRPFHGDIDDAGLWSRDLTDEEILALYNAELSTEPSIPGCTDTTACNYDAEANEDDSSCVYPPSESVDCEFGSNYCGEGTSWDPSLQMCLGFDDCPSDLNGNGLVEVSDLLMVLADFGTECAPPVAEWTCGDPVNYHGYDYATVQIGEQCWFAENLRTTQFRNGNPITHLQNVENWVESDIPGWCYYEDAQAQELETFGLIYNFFVVGDNICPSDWHIPNFAEWFEEGGLRSWIAGNYPEIDINSGGALKTIGTSEWLTPNEGATNQFDFSGRPSGGRNLSGEFLDLGTEANYHINNTFGGGEAHHVYLKHQSTVFDRASPWQGDSPETWHWGASIRCIKD